MRTAIDTNERALVEYYADAFNDGAQLQASAVHDLAEVLAISETAALDLLNRYQTGPAIIDRLGVETYQAELRSMQEANPTPQLRGDWTPVLVAFSLSVFVVSVLWWLAHL